MLLGLSLASSLIALVHPWPLTLLVDHVIGSEPMPAWMTGFNWSARQWLAAVAIAGVVLVAIELCLDLLIQVGWIRIGQQTVVDLTRKMFAHLQRRSVMFHARADVGDLLSRVTGDSWCVYNIAGSVLFTPMNAMFLGTSAVVILFARSPTLAWVALGVTVPLALISRWAGGRAHRAGLDQRQAEARIESHVQQALAGMPVVQSFAQEDRELRRLQDATGAAMHTQRRSAFISAITHLLTGGVTTIGSSIILVLGGLMVLDRKITIGELLLLLAYVGLLHGQLQALIGTWVSVKAASASIERVGDVLGEPIEIIAAPDARPLDGSGGVAVRLDRVTFGYDPRRPVLCDLSMDIPAGATIGIVGPTGAGKSTIAGLLLRLFDPQSGVVGLNGIDARHLQLTSLRAQIAIVTQDPMLTGETVREAMLLGRPDAREEEIQAALRAAGAAGFVESLEAGVDSDLDSAGANFSGGERQRLGIARALIKDAPLLILDEPTSALDAQTEAALIAAIRNPGRQRTTIIIAHRLSNIVHADQIYVLADGRIAESGTHAALLELNQTYARLWKLQRAPRTLREGAL